MSPDAKELLKLKSRGWFGFGDAAEIFDNNWLRVTSAIRELTGSGLIREQDWGAMGERIWIFPDSFSEGGS